MKRESKYKRKFSAAVMTLTFAALPAAQAGLLDEFSKAVVKIKQASDSVQQSNGSTGNPSSSTAPSNTTSGASYQLPQGLTAYNNASLRKRVDNPFDSLNIPVSVPINGPDGYLSPYSVPVEGRVTILQYEHRQDDSPLLIMRHYQDWLKAQGYDMVQVCSAPCKELESGYSWGKMVDASSRVDSNYLPAKPSYIAAYKPGNMVLVGVGSYINHFSSLVKVVEGKVLDLTAWQQMTASRQAKNSPVDKTQKTQDANPAVNAPAEWRDQYGWRWHAIPAGTKIILNNSTAPGIGYYDKPDSKTKEKGQFAEGIAGVYQGAELNGFLKILVRQNVVWVESRNARPEWYEKPTQPLSKSSAGSSTIPDGAELNFKLSSVKLMAEPKADANVVGTLARGEGAVYIGTEKAGFLQVTTALGDGWIDKRLIKLP